MKLYKKVYTLCRGYGKDSVNLKDFDENDIEFNKITELLSNATLYLGNWHFNQNDLKIVKEIFEKYNTFKINSAEDYGIFINFVEIN